LLLWLKVAGNNEHHTLFLGQKQILDLEKTTLPSPDANMEASLLYNKREYDCTGLCVDVE
jgi:hypothetical protein